MANICEYEIQVKGRKKAALYLYTMIPSLENKEITREEGTEDEYSVWMKGDCKWELDAYGEETPGVIINIDDLTEDDVRDEEIGIEYWPLTMRQKSELLNVEILAHSWSEESDFDRFEHYSNGTLISSKTDSYNPNSDSGNDEEAFVIKDGVLEQYIGTDKNINIPDGVTTIGDSAFNECSNLTSINIPESVTSIGAGAFDDCREITIHGSSKSIAETYAKKHNISFVAE